MFSENSCEPGIVLWSLINWPVELRLLVFWAMGLKGPLTENRKGILFLLNLLSCCWFIEGCLRDCMSILLIWRYEWFDRIGLDDVWHVFLGTLVDRYVRWLNVLLLTVLGNMKPLWFADSVGLKILFKSILTYKLP